MRFCCAVDFMRFFWIWVGFSWFILLFVLNWLNFLGYTLFLMFIVATYSDQVASSASFLFFFDTVNLNWLAILVVRYSLCCVMMAFADSCCCSFFFAKTFLVSWRRQFYLAGRDFVMSGRFQVFQVVRRGSITSTLRRSIQLTNELKARWVANPPTHI